MFIFSSEIICETEYAKDKTVRLYTEGNQIVFEKNDYIRKPLLNMTRTRKRKFDYFNEFLEYLKEAKNQKLAYLSSTIIEYYSRKMPPAMSFQNLRLSVDVKYPNIDLYFLHFLLEGEDLCFAYCCQPYCAKEIISSVVKYVNETIRKCRVPVSHDFPIYKYYCELAKNQPKFLRTVEDDLHNILHECVTEVPPHFVFQKLFRSYAIAFKRKSDLDTYVLNQTFKLPATIKSMR